MMLRRLIPAAAILLLALTACDRQSTPSAATESVPTAGVAGEGCPDLATGGKAVTFGVGDAHNLAGYVLGEGPAGVVLVHQSNGSVCQWLPYAKVLAGQGYRTFAIDVNGWGSSTGDRQHIDDDVVAAATYLRGQGVTSVVLVGASMGGTAVLSAATKVVPPVDGVVALSAPEGYGGVDAGAAVPKLNMPVLFICATYDAPFAADAQTLYDATPAATKRQLVLLETSGHGVAPVEPGGGEDKARGAVETFLKEHPAK